MTTKLLLEKNGSESDPGSKKLQVRKVIVDQKGEIITLSNNGVILEGNISDFSAVVIG